MAKVRGSDATIGVYAGATVRPLTVSSWIGDGIDIYASAAASAFGGSIEDFAEKETDDLDEAENSADDEDYDALYRASLVPLWTIGVDGYNN